MPHITAAAKMERVIPALSQNFPLEPAEPALVFYG